MQQLTFLHLSVQISKSLLVTPSLVSPCTFHKTGVIFVTILAQNGRSEYTYTSMYDNPTRKLLASVVVQFKALHCLCPCPTWSQLGDPQQESGTYSPHGTYEGRDCTRLSVLDCYKDQSGQRGGIVHLVTLSSQICDQYYLEKRHKIKICFNTLYHNVKITHNVHGN